MTMLKRLLATAAVACLTSGAPLAAEPDAGAYLAARQAAIRHDFENSARYLTEALLADPGNVAILENAMTAFVALGDLDNAVPLAEALARSGAHSQPAFILLNVAAMRAGKFDDVFLALERGYSVAPLVDGLAQGWAHIGKGNRSRGLARFDQMMETEGLEVYGRTHMAYALAAQGDYAAALSYFTRQDLPAMRYSRSSAVAQAQILSQLGRNPEAVKLIETIFAGRFDANLTALRDALNAGQKVPYTVVTTPAEAMADIYHIIASAVRGQATDDYTLVYARAASTLNPRHVTSVLMTAELLEDLSQWHLADATYQIVPQDDPAYASAQLARSEVLREAGQGEAALAVLDALVAQRPEVADVHTSFGDILRRQGRYGEAIAAYTKSLRVHDEDDGPLWFIHYARGMARHMSQDWAGAAEDFSAALRINPDQPQVLNYFGYALVERGEKLEEALGMIERAAAGLPDSGAVLDSLGWALFQLGQYHEAVAPLEQAAALAPHDPVINDHLGDVYWAVGRRIEARFQWRRAMSLDPEEELAQVVAAKLEHGLGVLPETRLEAALTLPPHIAAAMTVSQTEGSRDAN